MQDAETAEGQDHAGLATLLADQFAVLGDCRPGRPSAVDEGEALVFAFYWPSLPADELLLASGHREQVVSFRFDFLGIIAPTLGKLVELDLRREVIGSLPVPVDDPRDAMVLFALGGHKGEDREGVQGLLNWTAQVRRNAREKTSVYRRRRKELRRLRDDLERQRDERSSPQRVLGTRTAD